MKRVLLLFFAITFAILSTACTKEKMSVEDFYGEMLSVRKNAQDCRIYHTSVFNGKEIKNYKVYTKNQKVRVETVDSESYSNFNNLYIDNGIEAYKYNPYTKEAQKVIDKKEKKIYNPMQLLIFWGKDDAGYLNHIYKFGRDTRISNMACRIIRNTDPITRKEGFSYCVSPEYGVAIYFRVPDIKLEGKAKSEKITWVTKIEEDMLDDYLFELPIGAKITK